MLFTIITPSLNYGRFLGECLASVAAQEGVTLEHLVIDGGSTDDSALVAARFPHVTWSQEPDHGMSEAINKGFDRARGDWVMWLNADDILMPGALLKVAAYVRSHPEVDIVHGDCVFVGSDRLLIRRKYDHPMDELILLFGGCWIPSTSTFLSRRVLADGNRLDQRMRNSFDWDFYLKLLRAGYHFGYLAEPLAEFRWHDRNLSILHDSRRRTEDRQLQRRHLAERGWPEFLGWRPVLALLRPVFKVRRVALRWRTHRRLH
ncbi:MAG: glycosyltransferase family 2 protein [Verrucomicrobia bacterium]|nr:glycosyltransferase family 2 protein [Verrucomicrobiota bacterium]